MSPTAPNPKTITRAQTLRKDRTTGEKKLWTQLKLFRKHYNLHARQQVPIGPYIADFAIHAKKLIIEVDGEHHHTLEGIRKDKKRDDWLKAQGYSVLRFNTGELIENLQGCVAAILQEAGVPE